MGGIESVTLSDEEARRRGTQKTVLERRSPPTFDVLVEIQDRNRMHIHADVAAAVDALVRGYPLQPEVRYEPRTALDGGIDGLCFYRRIMASLAQHLAPDGVACFEIGFGQRAAIEDIVRGGKKFEVRRVIQDYNSIDRVAVIGARG